MSLLAQELRYFAKPSTAAISAATSELLMMKRGFRLDGKGAPPTATAGLPTPGAKEETRGNPALEDDVEEKAQTPEPDELDPKTKLGAAAALLEENGLLTLGVAAPNKEPDELDPKAKLGAAAALLREIAPLAPNAAALDVPKVKLEVDDAGASFAFMDIKCCTIFLRSASF